MTTPTEYVSHRRAPSSLSRRGKETQDDPGVEPQFLLYGCENPGAITTTFSFAQMVVLYVSFTTVFCQLTESCYFWRKHTKSTLNQEWEPPH